MSKFTVDSFIVELGFSENVIKGLQRVEKAALQSAQRIERNLNRAFKVDTKQLDSNLTSSLGQLERKFNKTFDKIEQRARNTKVFQFATRFNDTVNPPKQPRQPRISGNRAITAAYSANMSKLKGFDPILQKYIKSQFYGLSAKAGNIGSEKFNAELAKLNQSLRETLNKLRSQTKTASISKVNDSFNNLASNAIKLSGAFYSVMGALNAYKAIMNAGLKRDSAQRAAKFVLGDKASEAETFIRGLADKTGLNISEGLSSYAKFAAGAQGSMSQEQTQELFGNATAMSRLMGLSNDELNGILKAFEQMASKGKIQAEELRGQLGDRMAGAFKLFAEALGMTATELDKAMKDGKVLSADTLPKVAKQMGLMIDKAGGWAEVAKSTQTALGKLANNWDDTMVKIFSGSQDELNGFLSSMSSLLSEMGMSSSIAGDAIGGLIDMLKAGVDDIRIFNNHLEGWILQTKKFYYSLDDTKRKLLDEVGDGFINFVKGLAIALSAKTLFSATTGVMNLTRAITTLGTRANQVAGQVATGKGGGISGQAGGVGSALAIGYADDGYETALALASMIPQIRGVTLGLYALKKALDFMNQEVVKNANMHPSGVGVGSDFNPVYSGDPNKPNMINEGWSRIFSSMGELFNNATMNIARFNHPELNNIKQDSALTSADIQGLRDEISALSKRIQEPVKVSLGGEVAIKPDETSFMTFSSNIYDQYAEATLLSSSFPEDD
ncbi:TPA_asm: phage tail tape measure protein [Salmonella enterica subsp. enterica serovar Typhi str. 404ty]|uniref:Phage tail tape measure protein n=1 Tax=Salmonella enterica subsp. enterica serovar Typhi str. 404ty TaxID=497977 RepID=A0A719QZU9_SALTI|nr:phage tail tape measure protein [Salmonella enterica subsp. enterica serovar Typhi str. 404ty]HAD7328913.1 phage tail tape measure protein [Salmonella enterica subsp. enterica serovar Typhi str. 404ty]HAD7373555.1 phage tail tape measure protein [Salmonella enterica subsp. enterica serovar Typhi str. 404ty]HAD7414265.1 phage tail tape measure protein [Salmonella enterica subsp. enterica serovar Typhi str. 404ty]